MKGELKIMTKEKNAKTVFGYWLKKEIWPENVGLLNTLSLHGPDMYFGEILERNNGEDCQDDIYILSAGVRAYAACKNNLHNTTQVSDYIAKLDKIDGGNNYECITLLKILLKVKADLKEEALADLIEYLKRTEYLTIPQMFLIHSCFKDEFIDKKGDARKYLTEKLLKGVYLEIPFLQNCFSANKSDFNPLNLLSESIKTYKFTKKELGEELFLIYRELQKCGTFKGFNIEKYRGILYPVPESVIILNRYLVSRHYQYDSKIGDEIISSTYERLTNECNWNSEVWQYVDFSNHRYDCRICGFHNVKVEDAKKLSEVFGKYPISISISQCEALKEVFENEEFDYSLFVSEDHNLTKNILDVLTDKEAVKRCINALQKTCPEGKDEEEKRFFSYLYRDLRYPVMLKKIAYDVEEYDDEDIRYLFNCTSRHIHIYEDIKPFITDKDKMDRIILVALDNVGEGGTFSLFLSDCLMDSYSFKKETLEKMYYTFIEKGLSEAFQTLVLNIVTTDDYLEKLDISKEDATKLWEFIEPVAKERTSRYYWSAGFNEDRTLYLKATEKYKNEDLIVENKKREMLESIRIKIENTDSLEYILYHLNSSRKELGEKTYLEFIHKVLMKFCKKDKYLSTIVRFLDAGIGNKERLIELYVVEKRKEAILKWM